MMDRVCLKSIRSISALDDGITNLVKGIPNQPSHLRIVFDDHDLHCL